MPELIEDPVRVEAAGEPPKLIDEFAGRASNGEERVSVARMRSPAGWSEPGQRPEFDEYTVVLAGALHVETEDGELEVSAGKAILTRAGEWVRYSTPAGRGVCGRMPSRLLGGHRPPRRPVEGRATHVEGGAGLSDRLDDLRPAAFSVAYRMLGHARGR